MVSTESRNPREIESVLKIPESEIFMGGSDQASMSGIVK